ncbi:T9SS type B sorting domain-containing protein [Flavobacterium sp. 245]|uniref:DUF7948 domain-containing protein n=1 Tax=Flavobacterium sp. 245 TaxID=2512115 RepID=UPI00105B5A9C|nr:T9SS type B sorting domain-containing protein [Flavobacterium sp. 245]TDP02397.1 gliding motility-associated-like protein [Flavobacterium sp. 245]
MKHKLLLLFFIVAIQSFSQNKNQSFGFKENKGQVIDQKGKSNASVLYLLNSNGLNVQLKKNGFSYDIYEVKKTTVKDPRNERELSSHFRDNKKEEQENFSLEYTFHRIDIDFVNSNSKVELVTEQKSADFDNYYNVPNKPQGITGVYQYKQITYKNIYPNIDVIFSIPADPKKTVEYNFIIHPKGKISDIQLKFNGAETNLVDNKIQMNVRFGKMEETLPASWIEDGNNKKEISVAYRKIKKDVYGFSSSNSVNGKTIVIDPVPTRLWGTYYGGYNDDHSTFVFTKNGYVYLAGITSSTSNIASAGASQNELGSLPNSSYDSFFAKFNSDGTRVWGTYYGGSNSDEIEKIVVSDNNTIFIAGSSSSLNNISTTGSHQEFKSAYWDGFLAKFDGDGVREWATYYGGINNDNVRALTLDTNENIYISGQTFSTTNIATVGSHQPNIADASSPDSFIAKFNTNGTRIWGTYYGGRDYDEITDSKLDLDGNIIFLGATQSIQNIATPSSFKSTKTTADLDGFLAKFDPNGNRLWGTYFGGESTDYFSYLGQDSSGNIYCSGYTLSTTGISSSGVFQENRISTGLDRDGIIFKFNAAGFKIWGTYFYPETAGTSISTSGSIIFTGRVKTGFSSTLNTYQEFPLNNNSGTDSYLVKFNTNGQRVWATYFSGENADNAIITALDNNYNIYLAGSTNSKTYIATSGTYQTDLYPDKNTYTPNSYDAFLVKFLDCDLSATIASNSPICLGKTLELNASGGTSYSWTGPNGFTSTDQNPTIPNATAVNSGEYICTITATGGCDDTKKINVVIGDIEKPIPALATLPAITGDCNTTVATIPTANDACAGVINATTTSPLSYALPGTYTIVWNYNDGNGNSSTQNQTVTITSQPLPTANSPQTFCVEQNATLNEIQITGQNIKWYSNLTNGSLVSPTTLVQDKATYYASQTINGCESNRIPVTVNIQVTSAPTGTVTQQFCTGQNPTIANIQVTGTAIKWYDTLTNGSLLPETTNLVNGKTYYASQTLNNCEGPRFGVAISIVNTPSVPTANANQAFCKNENATLSNIQITGQNIKWYDTAMSASTLPNTTILENNRTYYASQTIGCEGDRILISVQIFDTPLPTGNNSQLFCIDENATLSNLNIIGTNLKWYESTTSGIILPVATLLQSRIYYATQTLNNCESQRFAVAVKIQDTQNPIIDSPQTFCIQQKAKIRDIDVFGQNLKWFESPTSNISLSESTLLENGITYYVSETINNCESDRIPVNIHILEATDSNCINLVEEIPFPKFFTPNGDGYNDYWTIDFAYLAPNTGIRIFDRYGKFIKELNKNTSWDGNYLGQEQPASDYWFIVTQTNGKEFRGHFSLKR